MENSIPALHIKFEGFTAFFKHPLTITGTQISMPTPGYSTLLGLISSCAGRQVFPKETRIGFEFKCTSTDVELERTERLAMDNKGRLAPHREGQGIITRRVHFKPLLDLYVTNLDLKHIFENPMNTPCLGRSQDIAWIKYVKEIELYPKQSGLLGSTMIPALQENIPAIIVNYPEWFDNSTLGKTRTAGPFVRYQSILPTSEKRFEVSIPNLYNPSDDSHENVIYLHQWQN